MARTSLFQAIRNQEIRQHPEAADGADIPAYRPTYENRLRLIGLHLDSNNLQRAKIIEVPGGTLVRAAGPDTVTDGLLEFPDSSFEGLYDEATGRRSGDQHEALRIKTDLVPTSYADVLRALGHTLDEWTARSILISEDQTGIYVSGLRLVDTSMQSRYAPFDEILSPAEVDQILAAGYGRRSAAYA